MKPLLNTKQLRGLISDHVEKKIEIIFKIGQVIAIFPRQNFLDNIQNFKILFLIQNGHNLANFQNIELYFFANIPIFILEKDFGLKKRVIGGHGGSFFVVYNFQGAKKGEPPKIFVNIL